MKRKTANVAKVGFLSSLDELSEIHEDSYPSGLFTVVVFSSVKAFQENSGSLEINSSTKYGSLLFAAKLVDEVSS